MTVVHIDEFKRRFARYIHEVESGETIILRQNGRALAEIKPLPFKKTKGRRAVGLCEGEFVMPTDFTEIIKRFEGR